MKLSHQGWQLANAQWKRGAGHQCFGTVNAQCRGYSTNYVDWITVASEDLPCP